jgi:hypothetical protein
MLVVAAKAKATAPAKVHLRDGNVDFIGVGLTLPNKSLPGEEAVVAYSWP